MSAHSSTDQNIIHPKDDVIAEAGQKAEIAKTSKEIARAVEYWTKRRHAVTLHNTPFDGRKRNRKVAKMKASRKANKKRKLYVRYGT